MKLLLVLLGLLAICATGILIGVFRLLQGLVVLADRERSVRFLAWVIGKRLIAETELAESPWNANSALAPSPDASGRNGKAEAPAPTERLDE